jgi:succinoglycan biosynthesis protein ExoM
MGSVGEAIVIAVPTFHRPLALDALLDALHEQAAPFGADILVVDNDPAGSARRVVAGRAQYVVEPSRGLAAVRNRALDEAGRADALVFIDDDETPAPGWLAALVTTWRQDGADAVSGRVESRFPVGFHDPWIEQGGFFRRVQFAAGASQPVAATNNLLLDLGTVRRLGLRFDERLGLSGGEDILFARFLVKAGGRIVSAPEALVFDDVPAERLTRSWVLRRAYRVGISTVRTAALAGGGLRVRLRGFAGGAARVGIGGGRWLAGALIRSPRHSARGARAAARGAGMMAGALGVDYREYALRHPGPGGAHDAGATSR